MRVITWLLLYVLITPVTGFNSSYLLNKFQDQESCMSEANRIYADMWKSYPFDFSYDIKCIPSPTPQGTPVSNDGLPEPIRMILANWLEVMHPNNDDIRLSVLKVQKIEGAEFPTAMFAVRVTEKEKLVQDYLVFISKGKVSGWTTARFPAGAGLPSYEDNPGIKHI